MIGVGTTPILSFTFNFTGTKDKLAVWLAPLESAHCGYEGISTDHKQYETWFTDQIWFHAD